jgi:hypothetical protein
METCNVFLGISHFLTMRSHVAIGTLIIRSRLPGGVDVGFASVLVPFVLCVGAACPSARGASDKADSTGEDGDVVIEPFNVPVSDSWRSF